MSMLRPFVPLVVGILLLPLAPPVALAAPQVGSPTATFASGAGVADGRLPLSVSWAAATTDGSAIQRYELQRRVDGRSWRSVSLPGPLSRSVALSIKPFRVIQFRVRAFDLSGTRSPWSIGAPTWLSVAQDSAPEIAYSGGWQKLLRSGAFGGTKALTGEASASVTFEFTGHEIAWIAQRGPSRGTANVFIDDEYAATVDLRSSTNIRQAVVFRAELDAGPHAIRIETANADGIVELDAFSILGAATTETLVGAGDISRCDSSADSATAAVVAGVEGIVYTAGDNVYLSGTAAEFANCYGPTWGAFKNRTRPAPGNHDYVTPGAAGYYAYFGALAGPTGKGWYRYDAGTWRIYSLNSECAVNSACALEQYDWLAADLAAEPHRCVMAYWHRPIFSTGSHGPSVRMARVFQLLYDSGTDLVLVGHDHHYERFAPARPDGTRDTTRGVRQFVVGTGGAALYAFETTSPLTEVRSNSAHGVLRLDLAPGAYSWQFLPIAGRTFTDSGTTPCH